MPHSSHAFPWPFLRTPVHSRALTYSYPHTHTHTHTPTLTQSLTLTHTHTCAHTLIHPLTHTLIHPRTPTHTHSHKSTHTHSRCVDQEEYCNKETLEARLQAVARIMAGQRNLKYETRVESACLHRWKLTYDLLLSSFAFNFNLCPLHVGGAAQAGAGRRRGKRGLGRVPRYAERRGWGRKRGRRRHG